MNKETQKQYLWHIKRARRSQQAGQQLTPMERLILHVDGEITRLERELADARARSTESGKDSEPKYDHIENWVEWPR